MYDFGSFRTKFGSRIIRREVSQHPQRRHVGQLRESAKKAAYRNDPIECKRILGILRDLRAPGVCEAELCSAGQW